MDLSLQELLAHKKEKNYELFSLRAVSQNWRSKLEVKEPLWKHRLTLIVPNKISSSSALLLIEGDPEVFPHLDSLIHLSIESESVVAILFDVPNEPQHFLEETDPLLQQEGRCGDALIAYSWKRYLSSQDPNWLVRTPMVKSILFALDWITAFFSERSTPISTFVLSGESKRAWASWLAASKDKRIIGLISIACDFLNIKEQLFQHFYAYKAWSPMLKEYVNLGLDRFLHSPAFHNLLALEDPYLHLNRIDIPKLIISASCDEYTAPSALKQYFPFLPGDNYLSVIPNVGHKIPFEAYFTTFKAFYLQCIKKKTMPQLHWQQEGESLTLSSTKIPQALYLFSSYNPSACDFRKKEEGESWQRQEWDPSHKKEWEIALKIPKSGFQGYFMEALFDEGIQLTTELFLFSL